MKKHLSDRSPCLTRFFNMLTMRVRRVIFISIHIPSTQSVPAMLALMRDLMGKDEVERGLNGVLMLGMREV